MTALMDEPTQCSSQRAGDLSVFQLVAVGTCRYYLLLLKVGPTQIGKTLYNTSWYNNIVHIA